MPERRAELPNLTLTLSGCIFVFRVPVRASYPYGVRACDHAGSGGQRDNAAISTDVWPVQEKRHFVGREIRELLDLGCGVMLP